uniref:Uncharacterized protein n=3 Tax=Cercopithecinae TaxID=9528 RepID=Q95LJ4_MACFA|nr:hypothetical protein [Macaca fascicularis]
MCVAEQSILYRRMRDWKAAATTTFSRFLPHLLFHDPPFLSFFPCQRPSGLAPFAFRMDSWLRKVPVFLFSHWHLS